MEWVILVSVYLAIGVGVLIWYIRGLTITSKLNDKPFAAAILFPQLLLLWPLALFMEKKRRRTSSQEADTHID